MRGRLFDSLVSIRERRDGRPHLGLGLHIVALIAKFHGGRADAQDLRDGAGVSFRVWFPRAEQRPAARSRLASLYLTAAKPRAASDHGGAFSSAAGTSSGASTSCHISKWRRSMKRSAIACSSKSTSGAK